MISLPWVGKELEDTRELMGDNYWPYGIDANRKVLEALFQYSYEQGLASCQLTIEELSARSARLGGPQTASSSTNRGLNESANGRVAEQGGRASDGHHVGLDKRLPSHGRSTRSALQSEDWTPRWTPVRRPLSQMPRATDEARCGGQCVRSPHLD